MPIHPSMKDLYPPDWEQISQRIRFERAAGPLRMVRGGELPAAPETGSRVILAAAHLDHNPANNSANNLAALCQCCHNRYDAPKRHSNRKHRAHAAAGQLRLFGSSAEPV